MTSGLHFCSPLSYMCMARNELPHIIPGLGYNCRDCLIQIYVRMWWPHLYTYMVLWVGVCISRSLAKTWDRNKRLWIWIVVTRDEEWVHCVRQLYLILCVYDNGMYVWKNLYKLLYVCEKMLHCFSLSQVHEVYTLSYEDGAGWKQGEICLPPGDYKLQFEFTLGKLIFHLLVIVQEI